MKAPPVDFDYQILRLTSAFYQAYPNPPYHEILKKTNRSYDCLLLQNHYDYFICVPYRTEINHEYAYHFTDSKRASCHHSGLDYSKMVIVKNSAFLDKRDSIIDQDEYVETIRNIVKIHQDATAFLSDYIGHVKGNSPLHHREFLRRYQFSTLEYFHKELELL